MGRYILNVPPERMIEAVHIIENALRWPTPLPHGAVYVERSYWLRAIKDGISITLCEPEAPAHD